jgi:hypothetical protein
MAGPGPESTFIAEGSPLVLAAWPDDRGSFSMPEHGKRSTIFNVCGGSDR